MGVATARTWSSSSTPIKSTPPAVFSPDRHIIGELAPIGISAAVGRRLEVEVEGGGTHPARPGRRAPARAAVLRRRRRGRPRRASPGTAMPLPSPGACLSTAALREEVAGRRPRRTLCSLTARTSRSETVSRTSGCPQRDSNPCYRLERPVSSADRLVSGVRGVVREARQRLQRPLRDGGSSHELLHAPPRSPGLLART
jgi:hypothetical protein